MCWSMWRSRAHKCQSADVQARFARARASHRPEPAKFARHHRHRSGRDRPAEYDDVVVDREGLWRTAAAFDVVVGNGPLAYRAVVVDPGNFNAVEVHCIVSNLRDSSDSI